LLPLSLEYSDIQKHEDEHIQSCILPLLSFRCATQFVTLREEYGLRMFKNRVLRILFGSSGKVLIGDWRKLQNEQLHKGKGKGLPQQD